MSHRWSAGLRCYREVREVAKTPLLVLELLFLSVTACKRLYVFLCGAKRPSLSIAPTYAPAILPTDCSLPGDMLKFNEFANYTPSLLRQWASPGLSKGNIIICIIIMSSSSSSSSSSILAISSKWVPPYVPWFCLRFLPD